MKATIHLTEDDIKMIVLAHMQKKFRSVNEVEIVVGQEQKGKKAGPLKPVFKEVRCVVELDQ